MCILLYSFAFYCIALCFLSFFYIAFYCNACQCLLALPLLLYILINALYCITLYTLYCSCIVLQYIAFYCVSLQYIELHFIPLLCIYSSLLHCNFDIAWNCIVLHCIVLHNIALVFIRLHWVVLITLAFNTIPLLVCCTGLYIIMSPPTVAIQEALCFSVVRTTFCPAVCLSIRSYVKR